MVLLSPLWICSLFSPPDPVSPDTETTGQPPAISTDECRNSEGDGRGEGPGSSSSSNEGGRTEYQSSTQTTCLSTTSWQA